MKKTSLLSQKIGEQTVTTRAGKVPIIKIESENPYAEAIMAVNFLRAGCPEVQLVIENGHQEANVTCPNLRDILLDLQLQDEKNFWLFGKPKLAKGGITVLIFQYHPLGKTKQSSPK